MRKLRLWGSALVLSGLMAALAGCGGGGETKPTEKPKDTKSSTSGGGTDSGSASAKPAGWGTVSGTVTWKGALPKVPPINVTQNQAECGAVANKVYLINDKNKGVENVVVYLVDAKGKGPSGDAIHPKMKDPPKEPIVMDQPKCAFEPRIVVMQEGQTFIGKNSATIPHNMKVDGGTDNPSVNETIPPGKEMKVDKLVGSPSPVMVSCTIHGWMKGAIRVFNHPYFARTDADGKFEIKNAPAGKWNIVLWHEEGWMNGGRTGEAIEIKADGKTDYNKEVETPKN